MHERPYGTGIDCDVNWATSSRLAYVFGEPFDCAQSNAVLLGASVRRICSDVRICPFRVGKTYAGGFQRSVDLSIGFVVCASFCWRQQDALSLSTEESTSNYCVVIPGFCDLKTRCSA